MKPPNDDETHETHETCRLLLGQLMMLSAKKVAKRLRELGEGELSRLDAFLEKKLLEGAHRKSFVGVVQLIVGQVMLERILEGRAGK